MVAPSLWSYEVVNGLAWAVRTRRVPAAVGDEFLLTLLDVGVRLVEIDPSDVWRATMDLGVSAYDAAYVSLAKTLDCPCWTADEPLIAAPGARAWVRPIGHFDAHTS